MTDVTAADLRELLRAAMTPGERELDELDDAITLLERLLERKKHERARLYETLDENGEFDPK